MTVPKILLFGRGGQVATELVPLLSVLGELRVSGPEDCSFEEPRSVKETIINYRPSIIVNGAAYTAVDQAESTPSLCFAVNATAVASIADAAKAIGALVVHYSTDYVFDGKSDRPYTEEDQPHPTGVYGKSKREGEVFLQTSGVAHFLFRTAWVYSTIGRNFMKTMLRLGQEREELQVVSDQVGSPTSAKLIASATGFALHQWCNANRDVRAELEGTYNLVASGSCSWHGFAQAIFDGARKRDVNGSVLRKLIVKNVSAICSNEYPTAAQRPAFSVLDNSKFQKTFDLRLADWKEGLESCLNEYYVER